MSLMRTTEYKIVDDVYYVLNYGIGSFHGSLIKFVTKEYETKVIFLRNILLTSDPVNSGVILIPNVGSTQEVKVDEKGVINTYKFDITTPYVTFHFNTYKPGLYLSKSTSENVYYNEREEILLNTRHNFSVINSKEELEKLSLNLKHFIIEIPGWNDDAYPHRQNDLDYVESCACALGAIVTHSLPKKDYLILKYYDDLLKMAPHHDFITVDSNTLSYTCDKYPRASPFFFEQFYAKPDVVLLEKIRKEYMGNKYLLVTTLECDKELNDFTPISEISKYDANLEYLERLYNNVRRDDHFSTNVGILKNMFMSITDDDESPSKRLKREFEMSEMTYQKQYYWNFRKSRFYYAWLKPNGMRTQYLKIILDLLPQDYRIRALEQRQWNSEQVKNLELITLLYNGVDRPWRKEWNNYLQQGPTGLLVLQCINPDKSEQHCLAEIRYYCLKCRQATKLIWTRNAMHTPETMGEDEDMKIFIEKFRSSTYKIIR